MMSTLMLYLSTTPHRSHMNIGTLLVGNYLRKDHGSRDLYKNCQSGYYYQHYLLCCYYWCASAR